MRKPSFLLRLIYFTVIRPVSEIFIPVLVAIYLFSEKKGIKLKSLLSLSKKNSQKSNYKQEFSTYSGAESYYREDKKGAGRIAGRQSGSGKLSEAVKHF